MSSPSPFGSEHEGYNAPRGCVTALVLGGGLWLLLSMLWHPLCEWLSSHLGGGLFS